MNTWYRRRFRYIVWSLYMFMYDDNVMLVFACCISCSSMQISWSVIVQEGCLVMCRGLPGEEILGGGGSDARRLYVWPALDSQESRGSGLFYTLFLHLKGVFLPPKAMTYSSDMPSLWLVGVHSQDPWGSQRSNGPQCWITVFTCPPFEQKTAPGRFTWMERSCGPFAQWMTQVLLWRDCERASTVVPSSSESVRVPEIRPLPSIS